MDPKVIFAKLEDIPEHLRAQATKKEDGTYEVAAKGLLDKNKELLAENNKFKTVYDKFKDLDNVDAKTVKQALSEMQAADERERQVQTRIAAALQEANVAHQREIATLGAERDRYRTQFEERVIDGDLTTAISAADGDPFLVLPQLRGRVKTVNENGKFVVKVVDDTGNARLNTKGEAMSLGELVAEAKQDKRFARGFAAPAASGSGAGGSGAGPGTSGNGVVTLTRDQAKDPGLYRKAMEQVKNDFTKIQVTD